MAAPKSGPTAKKILDESQIKSLAGIGCTMKEIAAFFNVHVDTLVDNYSSAIKEGQENGKVSVRRMMWEAGKKGNSIALKYLVHNILKEKIEDPVIKNVQDETTNQIMEKLNGISTEAILRIVRENEPKAV